MTTFVKPQLFLCMGWFRKVRRKVRQPLYLSVELPIGQLFLPNFSTNFSVYGTGRLLEQF